MSAVVKSDGKMARGSDFLLTPGPLPWRLDCVKRNPKSGAVYAADGRLVCVAAIGNAREIVRMANLFADCKPNIAADIVSAICLNCGAM